MSPDSPVPHQHKAYGPTSVRCAIITLSDSRTRAEDASGHWIQEELIRAGHEVLGYELIPDDPVRLRALVAAALDDPRLEVILTTGGTGISSRDGTVEVLEGFVHKRLDGFGELFRLLSYQEIGSAAMLSRAMAGLDFRGRLLVALPGSPHAVRLAMEKLILPELGHILGQARR